MGEYTEVIFTDIDELKSEWDKLSSREDLTLDYSWYKINERVFTDKTFYLTLKENDKTILIIPIFEVSTPIIWDYSNPINFLNCKAYDLYKTEEISHNYESEKYFLIASPFGYHSEILIDPTLNSIKASEVLKNGIEQLHSFANEREIDDIYFLCNDSNQQTFEKLKDTGYMSIPVACDCYMDVKYNSFEEYLLSLNSNERKNVRKEMKAFNTSNLKVQIINKFSNYAKKLAELESNLLRKYGYSDEDIDLDYSEKWYVMLDETYKNNSFIFCVKDENDEILGFSLFIQKNDVITGKALGFDYDQLKSKYCTYFNLAYYLPIKYAVDNKISKISLGSGLYDVKLRRGCKMEMYYLSYFSTKSSKMKVYAKENSKLEDIYLRYFNKLKYMRS